MKNIKILLSEPVLPNEKFHQKTKLKKAPFITNEKDWPEEWKKTYFKEYPRLDKILLPDPHSLDGVSLGKVLSGRRSTRDFSYKKISVEEISNVLFHSAGLRKNVGIASRPYPSAGARYPMELYIISQKCDIPQGVYHYNLRSHSLEVLLESSTLQLSSYFSGELVKTASVYILISAVFWRNMIKYGERGYRHILAEAGHIAQNFYLVSEALGLGVCALGGYADDKINKILDIDGLEESVVYVLALG